MSAIEDSSETMPPEGESSAPHTPNWVLHTSCNSLVGPFTAIPEAIRQVRDVAVQLSNAVEEHAKRLDEMPQPQPNGAAAHSPAAAGQGDSNGGYPARLEITLTRILDENKFLQDGFKAVLDRVDRFDKDIAATVQHLKSEQGGIRKQVDIRNHTLNEAYLRLVHQNLKLQFEVFAQSVENDFRWYGGTFNFAYKRSDHDEKGNQNPHSNARYWHSKILNTLYYENIHTPAKDSALQRARQVSYDISTRTKEFQQHYVDSKWGEFLMSCVRVAVNALSFIGSTMPSSPIPHHKPSYIPNKSFRPPGNPPSASEQLYSAAKRTAADAGLDKERDDIAQERAKLARERAEFDREVEQHRAWLGKSQPQGDYYPPRERDSYKPGKDRRDGVSSRPGTSPAPETTDVKRRETDLVRDSQRGPSGAETSQKGLFSFNDD